MFSKKFYGFCFILLIVFISLGSAYATQNNTEGMISSEIDGTSLTETVHVDDTTDGSIQLAIDNVHENDAAEGISSEIDDSFLTETIHVNDTTDGSIQSAIDNAHENDTIELEGYCIAGHGLNINKSLCIQGTENGAKLYVSAMNITSGNVILKNLNFTSNSFTVKAPNCNLNIINCTMGFIDFDGGNLTIINSTIDSWGYAGGWKAISIKFNGTHLNVINSILTHLDKMECYGYLTIINSTVVNNSGVDISCDGYLTIINSTVVNNYGLRIGCRDVTVINAGFINNRGGTLIGTCNLNMSGSVFKNNTINDYPEYIYDKKLYNLISISNNATILNNVFSNNTCTNTIRWRGESEITLKNNIFSSNYDGEPEYYSHVFLYSGILYSSIFLGYKMEEYHVEPTGEPFDGDDYTRYRIISKMDISDNFFGVNLGHFSEFDILDLFVFHESDKMTNIRLDTELLSLLKNWANLDLTNDGSSYTLRFVNQNNEQVKMPTFTVSIIDKETGNIILPNLVLKDGMATFNSTRNITLDNIYILNDQSEIINKPKANLSAYINGSRIVEGKLVISAKNNTEPIDGVVVCIINSHVVEDLFHINNGSLITHLGYSQDMIGKTSTLEVLFINREFGLTRVNLTVNLPRLNIGFEVPNFDIVYGNTKNIVVKVYNMNTNQLYTFPFDTRVKIYRGTQLVRWHFSTSDLNYYYATNKNVPESLYRYTNNGIMTIPIPKLLPPGTYKLVFKDDGVADVFKYSKIVVFTVKKLQPIVKAPVVISKFKKSKYFKVAVKLNKKPVKGLLLKVKVLTGKKYATFNLKTDSNGIAKLNTIKLKVGVHKVVIFSGNNNYKVSVASKIIIRR